jgi:hypothetical protein
MNATQLTSITHLFWTGGFDSTYRLLEIVLEKRMPVQPHYLIDSARLSTRLEINTMRKIKQVLFEKYPFTQQLILPTLFMETADLQPNREIKQAFQEINKHTHLGSQYDWLSRYCEEKAINEIEMAIGLEYDSNIALIVSDYIELLVKQILPVYRIRENAYKLPVGIIFKYFCFPVYKETKFDLFQNAKDKGWKEFVNLTWFCHKPKAGRKPCGVCEPCRQTIKNGLAFRIPLMNRVSGNFLVAFYKSRLFYGFKYLVKHKDTKVME